MKKLLLVAALIFASYASIKCDGDSRVAEPGWNKIVWQLPDGELFVKARCTGNNDAVSVFRTGGGKNLSVQIGQSCGNLSRRDGW